MRKIIILFLILVNVVYVWTGARKFGAQSVDIYSNWLFKAKVLYLYEGTIPKKVMENWDLRSAHWQYPYLWPVTVWQIYKIFGFNEQNIYNLFPIFYVLILLLAYINLRKSGLGKSKVLLTVYVYSMIGPLLAQGGRFHSGNADILITLLGWLIISFQKKKWLVAVLVMLASTIKTEGVFWAVFLLPSWWLVMAILPTVIWQGYVRKIGIPSDFNLIWPTQILFRVWGLVRGMTEEFLKVNNWYIIWPIYFLSIKRHPLWKPLILMLAGFVVVYLGTNIDTYAYVSSSFDRILLQLSPVWLMVWLTNK